MKKPGKYLKFYYECMQDRVLMEADGLRANGLCYALRYPEELYLFEPTELDEKEYGIEGCYWWGGADDTDPEGRRNRGVFTPFRQNVVLFLAAMKGELNGKEKT